MTSRPTLLHPSHMGMSSQVANEEHLSLTNETQLSELQTIKKVKTPEVNSRVLEPRGLGPVGDADRFREVYKEGKALLR